MYDYEHDNSIPEESRANMDLPRIENAVREILEAIGEDPEREGLQETPQRVARMYAEVFAGLHRDINKDIKVFHGEGNDEMIRLPFFVIKGNEKKEINQLAERIIDENEENRYAKDLMVHTLTVELMIILSRALRSEWEESLSVKNGKAKELVAIARQYMDANFDQGITVSEAAAYVYLSQGYFTRAFRDELGISPMNYLMKKRIEKACKLLQNNEIKVSAISLQSGFSSPQRFNVAFRKQMGMTPMEYRKKYL